MPRSQGPLRLVEALSRGEEVFAAEPSPRWGRSAPCASSHPRNDSTVPAGTSPVRTNTNATAG